MTTTPSPSSMDDSRKAFEAWCLQEKDGFPVRKENCGCHYWHHGTENAWMGWQASRATPSPTAWQDEVVKRLQELRRDRAYCSENAILDKAIAIVRETPIEEEGL